MLDTALMGSCLLYTSQIDETVVQARNLFLKNVSEDVEYLFNLKIDSVIMEMCIRDRSVGIEDVEDIIADLKQAFEKLS